MPPPAAAPPRADADTLLACAQTILRLYRELLDAGRAPADLARVRGAYDLATRLFAGRLRATGKTFLAHLVGTASIVAHVGGDTDLVIAALLHAAYAVGDFGDGARGVTDARRARLRAAVGARAEALVAAYEALAWTPADVARLADGAPADADVLLLRLANELEDHLDRAMLLSSAGRRARYRDSFPALGALAGRLAQPALARALAIVAEENYGDAATVPAELAGGADGSYVVLPASAPAATPAPASWWARLRPRRLNSPSARGG